jgi:hypothetical protein
MPIWLVHFAHWLQNTRWALNISGSDWAYPFVQATHFVGLSLWIGSNVAGDLRLLGVGNKRETIAQFWQALFVWNWIGFSVAVLGGFMLFSANAVGYVKNPAFRIKIGVLVPMALALHIVIQRKARLWGRLPEMPMLAKFAGLVEIILWVCVAIAAVSIPEF